MMISQLQSIPFPLSHFHSATHPETSKKYFATPIKAQFRFHSTNEKIKVIGFCHCNQPLWFSDICSLKKSTPFTYLFNKEHILNVYTFMFWTVICQTKLKVFCFHFQLLWCLPLFFPFLLSHCQFCLPLLSPVYLSIPIKRGLPQPPRTKISLLCSKLNAVFTEGPLCEEYCFPQYLQFISQQMLCGEKRKNNKKAFILEKSLPATLSKRVW